MKRLWTLGLVILWMICLGVGQGARAGVIENAGKALWPEAETEDWTLTLGMQVAAYPPYGEKRISQLNDMIQHMGLRIRKNGDEATAQVLIDGEETPALVLINGEETPAIIGLESEGTEPESEDTLAQALQGAEWMHEAFRMLDEGAAFLSELPEKYPEGSYEKKTKQKTKMGTAVRTVTVTINEAEEGDHPMQTLVREAKQDSIRETMGSWTFRGRFRFTLLYDAEGRLLKANCSGRAGEDAENLRNLSLEWRLIRTEEMKRDDLTLRTPTADGKRRDNWIIEREWERKATEASGAQNTGETADKDKDPKADGENQDGNPETDAETGSGAEERLSFTLEYDQKRGNEKTQYKWEGSLEGNTGLQGGVSFTTGRKNEKETITVRPALTECGAERIAGEVEFIRVKDKVIQEQATVRMDWQAGGGTEVPTALQSERAFAAEVLRSLLQRIDEADLGFLKDEIPEEDWQRILEAAGAGEIGEGTGNTEY